ncbi:MAG: aminotransferase class V-fold PLP-dependent enzyme [Actinomycetota bacterium]|nr:aminotransferase class V-fold PLP-dependent enzyme [Actinomycetota bacterium]
MDLRSSTERVLAKLPPRLAEAVYGGVRRIPKVHRIMESEFEEMLAAAPIERPAGNHRIYERLPEQPLQREEILSSLSSLASSEASGWKAGRASGAVYHGDVDHIEFLNEVYALHSQSNPLHIDLWPSGMKYEGEIVAMTASMLGGNETSDEIVGTVTSGGTESIIMAMKAYRDRSRVRRPEMVIPSSAHVAFDKAAHYFGYRQVRVAVADDYRANVEAMTKAVSRRTVVIAASAPGFPHGVIDPIVELSDMARERGIGFHTDACLGGFVLPWAERLGYDVPLFDFRLPGVTSISADTHKYGYAAKGTSVILHRGRDLRHHQYFVATDWPGGLYYSPTMAGSRPGALLAAAWAAMLAIGESGYLDATGAILETGAAIRQGINEIPDLRVLGDPLWVIAFTSDRVNIYEVMARMAQRGWSLNGLHRPQAVHIALTLQHTGPGVAESFLADLRESVEEARAAGAAPHTGAAPMYGMAATFPARGAVGELLRRYIDRLYEVKGHDGV